MNRARVRKSAFLALVGGLALVTLSACMNVTYTLNVNPDATISGKVQLAVSKQAASVLGITDADELNSQLQSGQLGDQTSSKALQNCQASEDTENLLLDCTITNAQASDIEENWSMTTDGDIATFHAVSSAPTSSSSIDLPGLSDNTFEFTMTFPGPISSVQGTGAVKTGENTATVKGTLDQPLDFTVVGSLSTGSTSMIWIYVLLGVLALLAIGVLAFVLRTGSRKPNAGTPELEAPVVPTAIEAAPDSVPPNETPGAHS